MPTAERDAIKGLLIETLALRLADDLNVFALPDNAEIEKCRQHVSDGAENALANFEKQLAVHTISDAVIDRLRDDLARRSRVSGLIEIAINVAALLLGLLGGAIVIFLDPAANPATVKALAITIAVIALLQFLGNLYLKHLDHTR